MLTTRQNKIPLSWVIMTMIPWGFFYFIITVNGVNFFILNRLIENPATLTFFMSLPGLLFMFIPLGAYINFMSDRIWTRWGRRKIFLVVGFSGTALAMFLYPLAPNIWFFLSIMFLAAFFGNFNAPFEALKLEIVPPDMRGRSMALGSWFVTSLNIVFWMMIIGRIDEVIPAWGQPLSGLKILYWTAAAGLLVVVFIYLFGIHEVHPKSKITGEKFNFKTVWTALSMPQLRYMYIFGIASSFIGASLGGMGMLLYINQWGYSYQEMGFNISVGGVLNLFLIPIIGTLADKGKNRMRIWLSCAVIIMLLNICYFTYVTFYLPDQRPSLVEIIFFGETTCIVAILSGMIYYPLVFDYIPRNLIGTYSAGNGILMGIVGFITGNGLGLFLLCWAKIFQPPAGEMVRVCLDKEMRQPQVEQILYHDGLKAPNGKPTLIHDVFAKPWYADGIITDSGICYEIRLRDADSENKLKHRDELKTEADTLEAKIKQNRKDGKIIAPKTEKKLADLRAENTTLGQELDTRVASWQKEVLQALDANPIKPGAEILSNTSSQSAVSFLPTLRKAKEKEVDKLNRLLRAENPSIIGMTTVRRDRGFALSLAVLLPEGKDKDQVMHAFYEHLTLLAKKEAPGLISDKVAYSNVEVKPTAVIDLALVEKPISSFISPISRGVNAIISLFTELPPPDQKLISLARNLCKSGQITQARVEDLQGKTGIKLTVVTDDKKTGDEAAWMEKFIKNTRTECASLKLTVPQAVVDQGVVPIKYNYLAGYLYVFTMVLMGFALVRYFINKEKAGIVRKLGAEEAHEEKQNAAAAAEASVANETSQGNTGSFETYTPGYLLPKILLAFLGLAILFAAFKQGGTDVQLLFKGTHAEAVATAVIVKKIGQADEVLKNEAELNAKTKEVGNAKDYSWTFYNQLTFETKEGKEVNFIREVGCKMKPSMPLLDENGLSTTALLLYNPQDPSQTLLPLEYSTWFFTALLTIFGIAIFFIGITLAWFANKPIQLSPSAPQS